MWLTASPPATPIGLGEALGAVGGTVGQTQLDAPLNGNDGGRLTREDGKITACSIEGKDETEAIGGAALETLAEQVKTANGYFTTFEINF